MPLGTDARGKQYTWTARRTGAAVSRRGTARLQMPDGDPVCAVEEVLAPSPVDDPSGQPLRFGTYLLTARGADFT